MIKKYIEMHTTRVGELHPNRLTHVEWSDSITDEEILKELEYFGATYETIGQALINVITNVIRKAATSDSVMVEVTKGVRLDVTVIEKDFE